MHETWKRARERWRAARTRRWVRWTADGLLVLLVAAGVMGWQTRRLPEAGTPAPAFALPTLAGGTVRLEDLRGKPVLLHFWAPWCGVCKAETANISALQRRVGDGAHVVSVALAYDDVADVRRFVEAQGVDYPVLLGTDALLQALRIEQFPTTLFLDEEGRVQGAAVGYTTQLGLHWRLGG